MQSGDAFIQDSDISDGEETSYGDNINRNSKKTKKISLVKKEIIKNV